MRQSGQGAVRLGLMPPLTGLVGIYGSEISRAGRIACDEVNEAGGVLGRPLELIIEDDGSLPEPAVEAATKLVDDHHCVAIIGNLLSNSRISVAYRVAEPRRVPYLNFSFYEGSILSRYFFHFAALPNQQIDRMIPYMREKFGPRMYFAGNNYEWPRGSIDAAKRALKLAGGESVGETYTEIGVSRSVIDSLLDKVEAAAPDVFVPYFAGVDQIALLTRFTERGMKSHMAVVMGHYDELMASKLPPEVREGFYSSNTYFMTVDSDANREYLRRLAALDGVSGIWPHGNGILTNFGEGAYLCVKAFAQAANAAGSLDHEALVDALNTIRVSGPQGTVQMDPVTQHAAVNTYLSRCNADGIFEIVERFGTLAPVMPERYSHQRVENRATLEEDIRLQARMLEQMSEAVLLVDAREGKIVYANGGADRMFGYAKGELLGLPLVQLNSPETGDPVATSAAIFDALSRTGAWQGNIRNIRKDGSALWCFVSVSTFTHPVYGEVWMNVHQDISARMRSEEQLQKSEERLRRVLDAVNDGVWDWNPETHENYLSPHWKAIFGYQDEELPNVDSTFFDMVHPDDRETVAAAVTRHFEHNEPFRAEIRMRHKDGNYRWTLNRGEAIRDSGGKPVRMVGTITDITQQKKGEELRERLSAIIEASPDFIGFADAKTAEILYINTAGRAMCGLRLDEAGLRIPDVHPEWTNRMFKEEILPTATRTGSWRGECAFLNRDGQEIPVSMVLLCHRTSDGTPQFFSTISRDITERKRTEEELHRHRDHLEELVRSRTVDLETTRDEAERANKAKSEFLARMSHELRTPMNAILGFAQVLEMEKLNDEQLGFAREIESAGMHLLDLINELLDLSRIESGKLATVIEKVMVPEAVRDVLQITRGIMKQRNIKLLDRCPATAQVLADPTRLKQILVNLLSNAVKYNREGGCITIGCEGRDGERLRLSVSDTGDGIPPEKLERLFRPFERLGAEFGPVEGTGIGLALSKQLAELMGGTLGVESTPGQGSTFWLELPFAASPEATASEAATSGEGPVTDRRTVLYVEDNPANLRVVEAMLRHQQQLQLLSATNGEHGLELAKRYIPDAILLDIHLPGMDGYAVFAALKADPKTKDIPVIALSADAMPLDIERGLAAGFVAYLTKPVEMDALVGALDRVARLARKRKSGSHKEIDLTR